MSFKLFGVIAGFLLLTTIPAFASLWLHPELNQPADPTPRQVTLVGEYVCLPRTGPAAIQTDECAFGLKTDTDDFYAVNFGQSAYAMQQFKSGARIRAEGFVVPKQALSDSRWFDYDIVGLFTLTGTASSSETKSN